MRHSVARTIFGLLVLGSCLGGSVVFAQEETSELPLPTMNFSDVETTNRYHDAIEFLYENGTVTGYEDNTFHPYDPVNRAEALKIILLSFDRMESLGGETEEEEPSLNFTDVAPTDWHYDYIMTAAEKSIVQGYDDGRFYPERSINRVEALKMVIESAGLFAEPYVHPALETDPANDVPMDSWFADYVDYALSHALTYLDAEGDLNGEDVVSRGEMADLIYRLQNPGIYSGAVEFGQATYYGKSWDGVNTASGEIMYQSDYVAAHKTLPFGTLVRVTNLDNGKTIVVKIIDRGPYGEGRIIDLSYSAFDAIADLSAGIANVEVETVHPTEETE